MFSSIDHTSLTISF